MTPFARALKAIDAANADDPNRICVDGQMRPAELVYSERMSAMLARLVPEASEALRLAARAQHLRRWTVPRDSYPLDRAGYHRWRGDLKRKHAEWTSDLLAASGIEAETTARVASLIRKEHLKTDAEAQALEDIACLVFLEHYAAEFAIRTDRQKMAGILDKTWKKMSEAGQQMALTLPLEPAVRAQVEEMLAGGPRTAAPAPVAAGDIAVVLAAHGDRGGDDPNATLLAHGAALAAAGRFRGVWPGLLRGAPLIEDAVRAALDSGARCLAVVPVFMSEGYFTRKVLAERLAQLKIPIDVRVLPPLGTDPGLPALMLAEAIAAAKRAGVEPEAARLLVVGHGSKFGPASADATRAAAGAIAQERRFSRVETAFLEETEFLRDALVRDDEPTVVIGFFSGEGLHAGEDVPRAIAEAGAKAHSAGSIGTSPALVALIRQAVDREFGAR